MNDTTETAYLCPVCLAELVRVGAPQPVWEPGALEPGASIIMQAVQLGMKRWHAMVEAELRAAIEQHDCAHPVRWRLWLWRQRREIAAAYALEARVEAGSTRAS
jgi:hypothetical protein